jgi:hypothetical protein
MHLRFVFAMLFLTASFCLFAQVPPSATEGKVPQLSIGAGLSDYNPDLGRDRMYGGTLWIDYYLNRVPSILHGIGLEFEARDISLNRLRSEPILREDTAGVGAIYSLRNFGKIRLYAKVVSGLGNTDYLGAAGKRFNQSRTVTSMGGGFDSRVFRRIWVRADYEYQYFPDFFVGNNSSMPSGAPLDPQGITLGAMFQLGRDRPPH